MLRVYIETSIPSAYFETRPQPEMVARRHWTREWWDGRRFEYELITSAATVEELKRGEHPHKEEKLALLAGLPLLPPDPRIDEIVETYVRRRLMPMDPRGDALHLAIASFHKCDVVLTWNCQHLANANKFSHIRIVNTLLGLPVPMLVTPLELLGRST